MYVGRDQYPADQDESEPYGFDFVNDFQSGETISTATWTITVRSGTDPSPSSKLIGSPAITGDTTTYQRVAGLLPNVVYVLKCLVTTNQGNSRALHTHVFGEPDV